MPIFNPLRWKPGDTAVEKIFTSVAVLEIYYYFSVFPRFILSCRTS
jgi:hypothetical protein